MADYTDLEIGLYYRDAESYSVDLRFRDPDALMDEPATRGSARFEFEQLYNDQRDTLAYGQRLTSSLFADAKVQEAFGTACMRSQERDKTLRLRLYIDSEVPELHSLRWEMLRDPRREEWLATGEQIVFSRFLRSSGSPNVKLRPAGELRALVFIANPSDLNDDFAPVQVELERERAKAGLGGLIKHEIYSEANIPGRATLKNLVDALRDAIAQRKSYDILYIVCHGVLLGKDGYGQGSKEPYLLLEKEDGTVDRARGVDLVSQLRGLPQQPWLVVLASCQSAGYGNALQAEKRQPEQHPDELPNTLAALGPRLADAGVPAVLAMQGNILMETVARFMQEFFKQLSVHGEIDRAVGIARSAVVLSQRDWWMPVLFMRLREGRISYKPGFRADAFEKWPLLLKRIHGGTKEDRCTPILGPGLLDPLLGSLPDLARIWSEMYRFPMASTSQEDLSLVAQYLTVNQDDRFPYSEFREYLCKEIKQRYGSRLSAELQEASADQLDQLIEAVAPYLWQQNPDEPHLILAKLPFKIYITANSDNLLAVALKEANKEPLVELCPWTEELRQSQQEEQPLEKKEWQLTVNKPLVYHLFGQLSNPDSLVLTEDDYFDYLIGVTKNQQEIPSAVFRAQTDGVLMFLGFQLDDWNFRVLFRSILNRGGSIRSRKYKHVAVQIIPQEGRLLELERARKYLEEYFGRDKISIYWGSSEEFLRELRVEWNKLYGDKTPI